jgi:hypothetical protein
MRAGIRGFLVLLVLLAAAGCTRHYNVPKSKQPCADECTRIQASCTAHCGENKGNPAVLEDVRGSLCEKRCKEDDDKCMLTCL